MFPQMKKFQMIDKTLRGKEKPRLNGLGFLILGYTAAPFCVYLGVYFFGKKLRVFEIQLNFQRPEKATLCFYRKQHK
jgi:hypothetical protein